MRNTRSTERVTPHTRDSRARRYASRTDPKSPVGHQVERRPCQGDDGDPVMPDLG
jgi:hypothetical protein